MRADILRLRQERKRKHSEKITRYYDSNSAKLERKQRVITIARMRRGMTQRELAAQVHVSDASISQYECGRIAAPWEALERVMPELKEMRKKGCEAYCSYPQPCVVTGRCKHRRIGHVRPCV